MSDFDGFDLVELHAEQSNLQLLLSLLLLEQTADQHYLKSQSSHEVVVGVLANSESHSDLIQAVKLNLKSALLELKQDRNIKKTVMMGTHQVKGTTSKAGKS